MTKRDDQLIQLISDRLDDQSQNLRVLLDMHGKHLSAQLSSQRRDFEDKHLQNVSKTSDIEKRLKAVEGDIRDVKTVWSFMLFLGGALGTFITWASGLLDQIIRAFKQTY